MRRRARQDRAALEAETITDFVATLKAAGATRSAVQARTSSDRLD